MTTNNNEVKKVNEVNEVVEVKKSKKGKIIIGAVAAVIVLAAVAFGAGALGYHQGQQEAVVKDNITNEVADYNQQVSGTDGSSDSQNAQGSADTTADIGIEKAKTIALAQVNGASESDIIKSGSEYEHGRLEYDVDIKYNGYEYEFTIDGETGEIISSEVERADWF